MVAKTPGSHRYGPGVPPTEEQQAEAALANMSQDLQGQLDKLFAGLLENRDAYKEYFDTVKVVAIEDAAPRGVEELTHYRTLIETFEGERGAQEGQVLFCLIEQMVASFVAAEDSAALAQEISGSENVLDGAHVLEQSVSAALQAAMNEFGAAEIGGGPVLKRHVFEDRGLRAAL